jgi:hypothetical protein
LDSGWFYDTNFHLNNSGAILFTKSLVKDLKVVLKNTSPTTIDDPTMPVVPPDAETSGDDSDLGCFTFEETSSDATIVGISDEGKTKDSLVVPFTYNGKKITSFTSNAMTSDSLKQVTIQSNIRFIEGASFDELPSLKRIVIMNSSPSTLAVGQSLLQGTNANIYVQKDVLADYKLNYSWSAYVDRIFPLE